MALLCSVLWNGATLLAIGTFALCAGGDGSCPIVFVGLTAMAVAIPIDAFGLARDPDPGENAGIGPFRELALTPLLPDASGRSGLALRGRF